jgi:hypothetical protein
MLTLIGGNSEVAEGALADDKAVAVEGDGGAGGHILGAVVRRAGVLSEVARQSAVTAAHGALDGGRGLSATHVEFLRAGVLFVLVIILLVVEANNAS